MVMAADEEGLFTSNFPHLNASAPDFEVRSTHGIIKLSDFRGKWLLLFSHPADFTPVCTTEFIGFARHVSDFKALNCELVGLSVDSTFSHLAWIRNIKEKFDVDIPFPIIEDISMQVAQAYGMVHPGASDVSAVRATFLIDPKGLLRAMLYYPMNAGRSVDELIRLLCALQVADHYGVATPEGWQPGEKVMISAPSTAKDAEIRLKQGYECADWYFCKKEIELKPSKKKTA